MKFSKQVVAMLAVLSLGSAPLISCERANLQEVLEEQYLANGPTNYTLIVGELNTPSSNIVELSTTPPPPPPTSEDKKETTSDHLVETAHDQTPNKPNDTRKTKRVKVITIAAPDYSIRIEAKQDTPLAINSTEDTETGEGQLETLSGHMTNETTFETKGSIPEELESIGDEGEQVVVAESFASGDGGDGGDGGEVVEVIEKKDKKKAKRTGGEVAEQTLDERSGHDEGKKLTSRVNMDIKKKNKKNKKNKNNKNNKNKNKSSHEGSQEGPGGEGRSKREVNAAGKQQKGQSQKRDKRETKKSGTSKNGKTKRSAEKSNKYNKSKGKGKGKSPSSKK